MLSPKQEPTHNSPDKQGRVGRSGLHCSKILSIKAVFRQNVKRKFYAENFAAMQPLLISQSVSKPGGGGGSCECKTHQSHTRQQPQATSKAEKTPNINITQGYTTPNQYEERIPRYSQLQLLETHLKIFYDRRELPCMKLSGKYVRY